MNTPMARIEKLEGYGNLTNLIRMTRVYMIEHQEGKGTKESPMRYVRTYFDVEGKMLNRCDQIWKA